MSATKAVCAIICLFLSDFALPRVHRLLTMDVIQLLWNKVWGNSADKRTLQFSFCMYTFLTCWQSAARRHYRHRDAEAAQNATSTCSECQTSPFPLPPCWTGRDLRDTYRPPGTWKQMWALQSWHRVKSCSTESAILYPFEDFCDGNLFDRSVSILCSDNSKYKYMSYR